jgi:hypothetical protein
MPNLRDQQRSNSVASLWLQAYCVFPLEVRLDVFDKLTATVLARMILYAIVQVAVFFYTGEPAMTVDVAAAHGTCWPRRQEKERAGQHDMDITTRVARRYCQALLKRRRRVASAGSLGGVMTGPDSQGSGHG